MTIDNAIKILEAATKLLSVLVWPALLVFVLIRFGSALREFIANLGEFSLRGAGIEASAKRTQAAAALAAATVSHSEAGTTPEATAKDALAATQVVAEIVTPRMIRRARRATVLWVDDRPSNNAKSAHPIFQDLEFAKITQGGGQVMVKRHDAVWPWIT
jgi:hypothetical protein